MQEAETRAQVAEKRATAAEQKTQLLVAAQQEAQTSTQAVAQRTTVLEEKPTGQAVLNFTVTPVPAC